MTDLGLHFRSEDTSSHGSSYWLEALASHLDAAARRFSAAALLLLGETVRQLPAQLHHRLVREEVQTIQSCTEPLIFSEGNTRAYTWKCMIRVKYFEQQTTLCSESHPPCVCWNSCCSLKQTDVQNSCMWTGKSASAKYLEGCNNFWNALKEERRKEVFSASITYESGRNALIQQCKSHLEETLHVVMDTVNARVIINKAEGCNKTVDRHHSKQQHHTSLTYCSLKRQL